MNEIFLQYVWNQRLYNSSNMTTTDGIDVEVLNPGRLNVDAGPDFFNAQVRVGNVTWAGNIEIHTVSDDWFRHGHEKDAAYDNVILHVVGSSSGKKIVNSKGQQIPEVVISYPASLADNYEELVSSSKSLPVKCAPHIDALPNIVRSSWLEALLFERLESKCLKAEQLIDVFRGDLDQVFFCMLARTMGGNVNSEPMEQLARHLPLKVLIKHNNPIQTEAILLGQSGILDLVNEENDDYVKSLVREYQFLKIKFSLETENGNIWKYARLRPQNFPDVRLAQLAALIRAMPGNFESFLARPLDSMLAVSPSDYWKTHFRLGTSSSSETSKNVGSTMRRSIVINAVTPYLIACARRYGDLDKQELAIDMLRNLSIEDNSLLRLWKSLGVKIRDEGDAQGLIQLTKEYCMKGRCLSCRFGHFVVSRGLRKTF